MPLTNEIKGEVQRLLKEGNREGAVALLMQRLNIDAMDADTLAEAASIELNLQNRSDSPHVPLDAGISADVKNLLREGQKISAVKLVKERYKLSLHDALKRVEEVEALINPDFRASTTASRGNTFGFVGKIFAGIGVLMLCIALFINFQKQQTIGVSDEGEGEVVNMEYSGTSSAPVIRYSWNGRKMIYRASVYTHPPSYYIGEKVKLFINRENPSDVVIGSFTGRWLSIVIVGGLGLFFTAFGSVFIFVSRKF